MPNNFKILNPEVVEETLFRCGKSRNALIKDIGGISREMVYKAMRGEPVPQEVAYKIISAIEKCLGKTEDEVDFEYYLEKLNVN